MNLQTRYDLEVAEDEIAAKLASDVQPLEAVTAPRPGAAGPESLRVRVRSVPRTSILGSNQLLIALESATLDVD